MEGSTGYVLDVEALPFIYTREGRATPMEQRRVLVHHCEKKARCVACGVVREAAVTEALEYAGGW